MAEHELMEETDAESRPWSDLPPELLSLIQSRLFSVRDRYSFKSVCKSWNTNTFVRLPPPLPPSFNTPYYDSPCLLIPQRSGTSWKVFHSVYNDFYYLDLPELANAEIRYSKSGWLLVSRGKDLFFFNPFTRVKMELPPSTNTFISLCFTCPPTTRGCSVLGIYSSSTVSTMDFGLIHFGQEGWKNYYYTNPGGFHISSCPPVFCKGAFYILGKTGNMSVFNPAAFNPYIIYHECSHHTFKKEPRHCYMAEVEGEIWAVFVNVEDRKFSIMTLDFEDMCWESLYYLDNKCLYVGPNGSFAEMSADGAMANTVYTNKFCGNSGVLHSLNSGSFHAVDCSFPIIGAYWLTETGYNSAWIKPTCPPTILNSVEPSTLSV